MMFNKAKIGISMMSNRIALVLLTAVCLAACGGGGGGGGSTPTASALSGVAAVGAPIANGNISVVCATGSALATTTNSTTGAWSVAISGRTLPCAVEVSGGTINGITNTTRYHSVAIAAGTVNVTPLTDLLVANLAAQDPGAWFAALGATPATLAAITQAKADTALANLRAALGGLAPLGTIDPITASFAAVPGDTMDDMLALLQASRTFMGSSYTYAALLGDATTANFTAATAPLNALILASNVSAAATYKLTTARASSGAFQTGITVNNVTKPDSQAAFCADASVLSALDKTIGFMGTLKITGCTFNGSTGKIDVMIELIPGWGYTTAGSVSFTYAAIPAAGVTSASGVLPASQAPGASVTITGANFVQNAGNYRVSFNGVTATPYFRTLTQLAVIVPVGATSGTLTLTDLTGNQAYIVPGGFTVVGSAPDSIAIVSVSPSSAVNGASTSFAVVVSYSLATKNSGMLMIGFNTASANSYTLLPNPQPTVLKGTGTYTFNVTATPTDWSPAGTFQVYVNLSENPHPASWVPLASASKAIALSAAPAAAIQPANYIAQAAEQMQGASQCSEFTCFQ